MFYIRNGLSDKARIILEEINDESDGMSKISYKQNRVFINKAKKLLESLDETGKEK